MLDGLDTASIEMKAAKVTFLYGGIVTFLLSQPFS